jgi:hypothetical protein
MIDDKNDDELAQKVWADVENRGKGGDIIATIRAEAYRRGREDAREIQCSYCENRVKCHFPEYCEKYKAMTPAPVVKENLTPEKTPETVKEIVADYLKKNGYDGLCRDWCGCGLDDIMPCSDEIRHNCRPAYAKTQKCSECDSYDSCDCADSSETKKTCYSTVKKD